MVDRLYASVDFASEEFQRYASRAPGDGGLRPGGLVFAEDLERFAGKSFEAVLGELVGGRPPDRVALGGPAAVALVHAAQMLAGTGIEVIFQGARGDDADGRVVMDALARTPVDASRCRVLPGTTPFTYVFSDPRCSNGRGERTFVNHVGAAWALTPSVLAEDLFDADIMLFGGTALTPALHRALGSLLRRAKDQGAFTVVGTVYDFLADREDPRGRWRLGEDDGALALIDLLVADREEALRTSGCSRVEDAVRFFARAGVGAVVVTQGAEPICLWSRGTLFSRQPLRWMPVSRAIVQRLARDPASCGDTTGCGDNFLGGLLASLAVQLSSGERRGRLDLIDACAWAVASGGFACFYVGGTYLESEPGEKRRLIEPYYRAYLKQLG